MDVTSYTNVLQRCALFGNIEAGEIKAMLGCLQARSVWYEKESYIVLEEDAISEVGIILEGSATVMKEDYWGNRAILTKIAQGEMFGESLACMEMKSVPICVKANEKTLVLFIDYRRIITTCSSACTFHVRLVENMIKILARKNVMLTNKIEHIVKRTTREKLLSYFSQMAKESKGEEFVIPFNRQELADYLSVDRSAMCSELSKLKEEGIVDFWKNHFRIRRNN